MTQCDYDGVFYRVFCVTLLVTAFSFTMILTNVFIDIDGLLSKNGKNQNIHRHEEDSEVLTADNTDEATVPQDSTTEGVYYKNDADDQADGSRTKRSLDVHSFPLYIEDPKSKGTYRLTKLIGFLDEEKLKGNSIQKNKGIIEKNPKTIGDISSDVKILNEHTVENEINEKERLRLEIYKGFLQDVIGHMNLNGVNNKINTLDEKFDIVGVRDKEPNLLIKTIVDIRPTKMKTINEINNINLLENIKSSTKIIYDDDKSRLNRIGGENKKGFRDIIDILNTEKDTYEIIKTKEAVMSRKHPKNFNRNNDFYYTKKAIEYFKNNSVQFNKVLEFNTETKNKSEIKRLKRQVKIRFQNYDATTTKIKPERIGLKKPDDELFVEIETHFDGKGFKGEKKKKLIQNLINRIQKAISSDFNSQEKMKKTTHKRVQIKKRIQDPIKTKYPIVLNKLMLPFDPVEHRQLNPINKVHSVTEDIPEVERSEENWNKKYLNSNLMAIAKSINSGMEDDMDIYSPNILNRGIPQRLQLPLNNEDKENKNTQSDNDNVTLFIKDIDGSGFSVGFNQYVDEPPDVESMKLFSGLEHLIKSYHNNYDQTEGGSDNPNGNEVYNSDERYHNLNKRNANVKTTKHLSLPRSIQELSNHDYNSNEYKVIFDKKFVPFENYQDKIQEQQEKGPTSDFKLKTNFFSQYPNNLKIITKDTKIEELPVIIDDNEMKKILQPSDTFSQSNIFKRKRRSVNVQKITNIKSRIKLNRYLNTKSMQSKKIFMKNKRNKRQIGKIRIIASDISDRIKNSDENVFLVSNENLFTNRAVLREIELPDVDTGEKAGEEHFDDFNPYVYEDTQTEANYLSNQFNEKSTHNLLMSKYPHIFKDTTAASKEENNFKHNQFIFTRNGKPYIIDTLPGAQTTESNLTSETDVPVPEIVNALMPSAPKSNYKVTVKIMPKNLTNPASGFKEMHTTINKTYHNNGLQYTSLVNVSQISKIEKINKTKGEFLRSEHLLTENIHPMDNNRIKEQENKIKLLLALEKTKLEEQLEVLNKKKQRLETILHENDNDKEKKLNDLLQELLESEMLRRNVDPPIIHNERLLDSHISSFVPSTTYPTTTTEKTANPISPTVKLVEEIRNEAPEKSKIFSSIKQNENFTNEILSKINKNTDILESFLKKLNEKISTVSQATPTLPHIVNHIEKTSHLKTQEDIAKDWVMNLHQMHNPFLDENSLNKSDTHYSIPFVYAYQHPYLPTNKQPTPMTKVFYHGHIHTNTVHHHPNEAWNYNTKTPMSDHHSVSGTHSNNGTKFFIDSLSNDFNVPPAPQLQKKELKINNINMTNIH